MHVETSMVFLGVLCKTCQRTCIENIFAFENVFPFCSIKFCRCMLAQISAFCHTALLLCDPIIHPRYPALRRPDIFPVPSARATPAAGPVPSTTRNNDVHEAAVHSVNAIAPVKVANVVSGSQSGEPISTTSAPANISVPVAVVSALVPPDINVAPPTKNSTSSLLLTNSSSQVTTRVTESVQEAIVDNWPAPVGRTERISSSLNVMISTSTTPTVENAPFASPAELLRQTSATSLFGSPSPLLNTASIAVLPLSLNNNNDVTSTPQSAPIIKEPGLSLDAPMRNTAMDTLATSIGDQDDDIPDIVDDGPDSDEA